MDLIIVSCIIFLLYNIIIYYICYSFLVIFCLFIIIMYSKQLLTHHWIIYKIINKIILQHNTIEKGLSNNVTIDLSAYVLKIVFGTSFNNLQSTKQDRLVFTTPLKRDLSKNVTVDLSAYVLKTNLDTSLNNK
jgi:hypothetical protein